MSSVVQFPDASAEDRSLAASILTGEPEAIDGVRRWVRAAASPFRRSIGADLEDIEQEILISLTETLRSDRFRGASKLSTYVKKATVYRCLNRVRNASKRTFVSPEDLELRSQTPEPHQTAESRDATRHALRLLAAMSPECRDLWNMVLEGLSYSEMSERLGVAAGALRVRMLRCRRKAHVLWEQQTGQSR